MVCRICSMTSSQFARAVILERHDVAYYRCDSCGFVQTEEPYWLEEAYSQAINRSDVGIVSRNLALARLAKSILCAFFDTNRRFLDYGGGYGLLVRLMRDAGLDFYLYDKHCESIFAADFTIESAGSGRFELLTAFEVFEHLVDPVTELGQMLTFSDSILLATSLLPAQCPKPGEWWYYGLDHGQHVSFFTLKALAHIAETHSLNLYSDGRFYHLLTPRKINPLLFRVFCRSSVATLMGLLCKRASLFAGDYEKITGRKLS